MSGVLRAVASSTAPRRLVTSSKRDLSALITPLEEFPGVPKTTPQQTSSSTARITTLLNGLTVISENSNKTTTLSLTFPHAGSSSEQPHEGGSALINKYLSFNSGSGLSTSTILRNLEDGGVNAPFSNVGRFCASVGLTASRDEALRMLPLLATTSSFETWDVRDAKANAKLEVKEAMESVQNVLTESIFAAGYGAQTPAGKTIFSSVQPSTPSIQSFRNRTYILNGAVLAATGVTDHEDFVKGVEEGFSESLVGEDLSGNDSPSLEFTGGEERLNVPGSGYAHMALGFNVSTSNSPLAEIIAICIDINNSSSSHSPSGFTCPVGIGGKGGNLIGAYSGVPVADAPSAIDTICSILTAAPSADVIERAKTLAKAKAVFQLEESSRSLAEGMTSYVLASGEGGVDSFSVSDLRLAYDEITVKDVKDAFEGMVAGGSPPALAVVGNLTSVPYLGSIVSRFG